jgi:uncharacterized protein
VVGTTAAMGAVVQSRDGNVHPKAAFIYGVMGMIGAALGAQFTALVPPPVLMVLFAALMIWIGLRMMRGQSEQALLKHAECIAWKCALAGLGIGILTGFLGVGGGFLIVPALLRFAKMPINLAVGTSLVIIAVNSFAGLLAHRNDLHGGMSFAAAFTLAALLGLFAGMALGKRISPEGLKTVFGGLSLGVAALLLLMNLRPLWALIFLGK